MKKSTLILAVGGGAVMLYFLNFAQAQIGNVTVTTFVNPSGGKILSSIHNPIPVGRQIIFTAIPDSGYTFQRWLAGPDAQNVSIVGTDRELTMTFTSNYYVEADFVPI